MAYVIGSQKGKDIAKEMKTDETYQASDGSVWTKKADGSVSVKTSGGETYDNAYKPTSSGNSQYTNTGTWDANTDYGTIGLNQIGSGASWQDVLSTYNTRKNKATNTAGLEGYADDYIQQAMLNYVNQQKALEGYQNYFKNYEANNPQPTAPQSDPRIDQMLNEILNRDEFSYDVANDPLYQQYRQMYQREGDRAMRDTLAEIATGAGGMNSYAVTAAQQANNYYNSQLNDKIPELYQLAYNMHLQDIDNKVRDLGLLQNMDATQYARYRDTMNDWQNDKSFAYGVYNDAVNQGNWNTEFNNNNYWKNKDYDFTYGQTELENSRYDQDKAIETIAWYIENGVSLENIDPELIAKSGLNENALSQMITNHQIEQQNKAKGGGSGGGGGGGNDDNPIPLEDETAYWTKGIGDLGLGSVYSPDLIVDLAEAGAISEKDGKLVWNSGWNAQNFSEKLAQIKKTWAFTSPLGL